jgi:hypothetical protein
MSDQPVNIEFLGRIVRDMQVELRDLRTRVGAIDIDVAGLKMAVSSLGERVTDLQRTTLTGFQQLGESNHRLEQMLAAVLSRP